MTPADAPLPGRRPRSFRHKLIAVGLLLCALIVGVAGASYWMSRLNQYHLHRLQLAHQVHKEYLVLSTRTQALFRQLVDATLTLNEADEGEAAEERISIEAALDRIRLLIADEVALTDGTELEQKELTHLAEIERALHRILAEFDAVHALIRSGQTLPAEAMMIRTLQESIDRDFNDLIETAVAEEARESQDADRAVLRLLRLQNTIVLAAVVLALGAAAGAFFLLLGAFSDRIRELEGGILALEGGAMSHRLPVTGGDEFSGIAAGFNRMAAELESKQKELELARQALEAEVGETADELRKANDALRRHDRLRQQFFADISHELRTPITVIRGESQFILRGGDKSADEYKDALRRVEEQARQVGRLVDDLLYIARSDAGAARLKWEPVALDTLIGQVCDDARVIAAAHSIHIDYHAGAEGLVVPGDEGRLRQLFLILLENAVCYSRPAGRVETTLGRDDRGAVIEVADTGVGIPPEEQDRVLERFYRGSNAMAMNTAGSGLGLPVAKAIVEAHGGSISLASRLGKGTRVTVTLPESRMMGAGR